MLSELSLSFFEYNRMVVTMSFTEVLGLYLREICCSMEVLGTMM